MAEYVTKIRTEYGDKQIDYLALANLPQSDKTLSISGGFADAKITGDKMKNILEEITSIDDNVSLVVDTHLTKTATDTEDGHMAASDKVKLDGIEDGANNYILPVANKSNLGGVRTTSEIETIDGLTACPIIDGVPYCKNIDTVATTSEIDMLSGLSSVSEKPKTQVLTLLSESWSDNQQTVTATTVTANNLVIVSPEPTVSNYEAYYNANIRCIRQADGELTFACDDNPSIDVTVNTVVFI